MWLHTFMTFMSVSVLTVEAEETSVQAPIGFSLPGPKHKVRKWRKLK